MKTIRIRKGESEQNGFGCVSDPKNPRSRFGRKRGNQSRADFGVSVRVRNPLSNTFWLQKEGIVAERIWVCFGFQKQPASDLLVNWASGQNGVGCVSDSKNPRNRFACKGGESEQSGFGCVSDPKSPEFFMVAKDESEQSGFGCVSGSKNSRIRFARREGNRSRPDLGVFRVPKTPESDLHVKG
jgi:hypothetical protein